MNNHINPLVITILLSSVAIFAMAMSLIAFIKPRNPKLKNYYISRRLLSFAYLILSISGLCRVLGKIGLNNHFLPGITLVSVSFQAFLLTFSLITLINIHYITIRRIIYNLLPICMLSGALLFCLFFVKPFNFNINYIFLFFYCGQLAYYFFLFTREYNQYSKRMDNYFPDDKQKWLGWIKVSFYSAFTIAVMAITALFIPLWAYIIFIILYTIFYIHYAMKYISYISIFHYISPVFESLPKEENNNHKDLDPLIASWVEKKGFIINNISLDILAVKFMTNRSYLSAYINNNKNKNFKTWIGELRIEEAKRLMVESPNLSLSDIAEKTGFKELCTFSRQFSKITGNAPTIWRREHQEQPESA